MRGGVALKGGDLIMLIYPFRFLMRNGVMLRTMRGGVAVALKGGDLIMLIYPFRFLIMSFLNDY